MRRWRGRSMRLSLKVSSAPGEDSWPLEPPVVMPWSLPADCSPLSDALALASAEESDEDSLSEACGSPGSDSDGLEPSCSSPWSGELVSSSSLRTGWPARGGSRQGGGAL